MNGFKETCSALENDLANLESANKKGREAGIAVNKDGNFSARSNLGKELRSIIDHFEARVRELKGQYLHLRELPSDQ